jgi:hypothetical protein
MSITLKAKFDGEKILLVEPYLLEAGTDMIKEHNPDYDGR